MKFCTRTMYHHPVHLALQLAKCPSFSKLPPNITHLYVPNVPPDALLLLYHLRSKRFHLPTISSVAAKSCLLSHTFSQTSSISPCRIIICACGEILIMSSAGRRNLPV